MDKPKPYDLGAVKRHREKRTRPCSNPYNVSKEEIRSKRIERILRSVGSPYFDVEEQF